MDNVTRWLAVGPLPVLAAGCATPQRYVRAGASLEDSRAAYQACRDAVAGGTYAPFVNPSGTVAGAAAAGAGKGFSEAVQEYRLTQQCMRDRGFTSVELTPEQLETLETAPAEERDRLIGELQAQQG